MSTYFLYDFQSDSATISASVQDDNFPVGNIKSKYPTFEYHAGSTSCSIDFTFSSAPSFDAIGIIGNFDSDTEITLQSYTDSSRTLPALGESIPPADVVFYQLENTYTAQYYTIFFTATDNIEMGRLVMGTILELPGIAPQPTVSYTSTGITQFSNSGLPFGIKGYRYRTLSFQWPNNLTQANIESIYDMFDEAESYTPIFCDVTPSVGVVGALYATINQDSFAFARIPYGTYTAALDLREVYVSNRTRFRSELGADTKIATDGSIKITTDSKTEVIA